MSRTKKYAFLGVGNMASAIIEGMKTDNICLYDCDEKKYDSFSDKPYVKARCAADAVSYADYVILAVKPQNIRELLNDIRNSEVMLDGKVFVSIAAAVPIDYICSQLGSQVPVIRTIPNTPLLIGSGVTALCRNELVETQAFNDIMTMFSSRGIVFEIPENKMNTIIAVTSSSPAYVYLFIKAIADVAAASGIDNPDILTIVADTVIGAAEMIKHSILPPDELIRAVTSSKGTTEKALNVLNESGFTEIIAEAMRACTDRADEISAELH
ncbi:MAG: pyrroline-5-carboxylate reductase [Eubacteriales bacterium]|nr:pyrroline-5-carboxylate reductase [Eubacteriales bacterium]